MVSLTGVQRRLVRIVGNLATGITPGIPVGPEQRDIHGRQLNLRPGSFQRLFSADGRRVSSEVEGLLSRLHGDEKFRLSIQGLFKGYDVRGSNLEEAFWVLFAMSYAKNLVDRTGKRDGHIIHIGQDCYSRHDRVREIIAYTLIKTGVCDNGGGIVNWGVVDGGTMKLMGSLERAQTGENGNWLFATVSHKATDATLTGAKIGMEGKVVCVEELESSIWETIIRGDFLPLQAVTTPEEYTVSVGDITPYSAALAARMIRARTSVLASTPDNALLSRLPVAFSRDQNPLVRRMEEIAGTLGANVLRIDSGDEIGEPTMIRDPHELETEGIRQLLRWLNGVKEQHPRVHIPYIDPDGDRVGIVSLNSQGVSTNVKGTGLLKLAAHNLAVYNPNEEQMAVVADMRALMSARKLGEALTKQGYPLKVIPGVPGYNMFHLAIAKHGAVLGVEDTSHTMITPSTHPAFGAPASHIYTQGGDNAGLLGMFLLGLAANMWEGRTAAQQLEDIHANFSVPYTRVVEHKPALPQSHGMAKVAVADAIRVIGQQFSGDPRFIVTPFDTGVCLEVLDPAAAILVRHSKSGPGFTIGAETMQGDAGSATFAERLGVAMLMQAEVDARRAMQDPGHPLHAIADFRMDLKDAAAIAAAISNPAAVITEAAKIG